MPVTGEFFRILTAATALALLQACGAQEATPAAAVDPAPAEEAEPAAAEPSEPADGSTQSAEQAPAEQEPVEASTPAPDGAFLLEWSANDRLCNGAADALDRSHIANEAAEGDEKDYAARQARRFLSTDVTVDWSVQETPIPGSRKSEAATFDYFNDGVERNVVRLHGDLAGQSVISLGVVEPESAKIARLSFSYAGAGLKDLPDQDNLNTKLAYSVNDVVKLPEGYFTLVMPLEDVDGSGRIYLAQWRAKEGTAPPRAPTDYYAELVCVFHAQDAEKAK